MANIFNRQNLSDAEALNAVSIFDDKGRFDTAATIAVNNEIFHPRNTVVGNVAATLAAQAATKNLLTKNRNH